MDRPIGLGQIELFVGNGDPAMQDELCSSLEKCGVCIDHFCQSHPIMYLQHFHAILESFIFYIKCRSAVTGSPQITKTALSWVGLGFVAKSRRVEWEWGGHTTAKQKNVSGVAALQKAQAEQSQRF